MTCCEYGKCTGNSNCPVRKQHANKAYAEMGMERFDPDPAEEIVFESVKMLIAVLGVVAGLVLIALAWWGKL
jgi:hypothetical protein